VSKVRKAGTMSNGLVCKYGLSAQGIEPSGTNGQFTLVGNAAIANVYTSGPLYVSTTGALTGTAASSIFSAANGAYDFGLACIFNAADIKNITNMYAQFDQYRILKVRVNVQYLANSVDVVAGGSFNSLPTMYYCIDKDNAAIPNQQGDVTGQSNHKKFQFSQGKSCSITFTPCLRMLAYQTQTGTQAWTTKSKQWIDTAHNSFVPHFGLKMWFTDAVLQGANGGSCFRFTYDYWLEFKSPILTY